MGKFQSSKVFDGFSTVFRQWKAETTHCRFVHGYGISFKVYFEGELDERNWVWDFGGMKRAEDDPWKDAFQQMGEANVAQVRIIPATGAEKFAEYIYTKLNSFVKSETVNRVRVTKVKFMEHGKNAAYYSE